jgi:O-succinylbenzoate synthase
MPTAVDEIELWRLRMPLVHPLRSALETTATKDTVLVRVRTRDGDGWGECSALTSSSYLGESLDDAYAALREHLAPRVLAGGGYDDVETSPAASAALECALLDLELRTRGRSLADELGATATHVPAGVVLGLSDDIDAVVTEATRCVEQGYGRVKLKIGRGHDLGSVREVRDAVGADVALQVDANGSYSLDDADELATLDAYGLQCVEQPLAADAFDDHAELGARMRTPIALDESITSVGSAVAAIEHAACRAVVVKPVRLGGLRAAGRVHDACATRGVPVIAGGMFETGLGRAALVALAAMPNFTLTGDVAASDRYFVEDVTEPFVLDGGALRVPAGPGLGVDVRLDVVERLSVSRERLVAGR